MIRIVSILILFLANIYISAAQNPAEITRQKLIDRDQKSVIVVAHRGDWRNSPENSLQAIENAVKMGVEIVEIDVQRTKDGYIILMHDRTLDRTTTGKGAVSDWSLDSIRMLRLKNGAGIPTKHAVPTLEEALIHAKGRIMLNLDKAGAYFDQIYSLLEQTGTTRQIIMKGTETPEKVKEKYGSYLKDILYMPIIDLEDANAEENINTFIDELNPVAFELLFRDKMNERPIRFKSILDGKALIWYNTLWDTLSGGYDDDFALDDPDASYGYLIDKLGARIIQTDRPFYLIEYLRNRK